jgi:hypothetical protein
MGKTRGTELEAIGLIGAVGNEVAAEFTLGRLDSSIGLTLGRQ